MPENCATWPLEGASNQAIASSTTKSESSFAGSNRCEFVLAEGFFEAGVFVVVFPSSFIGQSCNIAIKHRNSIQTWSAAPVVLTNRHVYDFASSSSASYADNVINVDPSTYAFFTGDINQDDFIDIFDFPQYDADNLAFVFAEYVSTDLNGDGFVDIFDFPLYDVNNLNFVFAIYP